ncbi:MAG: ABC transporter ATP-binding protein [Rhodovibrionaceae bacterium]|nr:ABC transporter ATP-binding protein [Rhodovibrionaceae bacterium]
MSSSEPTSQPQLKAPGLQITGARLSYGGQLLFDGLGLDLPAGSITALLGPSGVGKTSLLRLIAGLAHSAEGSVAGTDGAPVAGRIAYMAQQDLLLPWLRVRDNICLGTRVRGEAVTAGTREAADRLLDQVGLAGVAEARPSELSGGMRQRTALARTLMEDRPFVLMDEPFSSLDAITRLDLQDLAARLLAGRTVLLVTHDPLEALRLAHRVHVMAGRPARLDAPLEPPGEPPRPEDDTRLLSLQAELLHRLHAAWRESR